VQNPSLLREEALALKKRQDDLNLIVIDEVQKVPELLDEVHWLIENLNLRFILCGSSARKVRKGKANLLGGRALGYEMFPLVSAEVPEFDLEKALNHGMLPRHYLHSNPDLRLRAYTGNYLKEEIQAESLARNLSGFSRFLEVAALSNGELLSYENIARECGVSSPTVRAYYEILVDTLIGSHLPSFMKIKKRRLIRASKFYFFDTGVVGSLTKRGKVRAGSPLFGKVLEHFIFMELRAHRAYCQDYYDLSYWRTASGLEVDFILGNAEVGIEVKSTTSVKPQHLRGLRAFKEEYPQAQAIVVSLDIRERLMSDGTRILPIAHFLDELWSGNIQARTPDLSQHR